MKESKYNDNELVYMIQQGDEESFRLLLELYQPKIYRIIRQKLYLSNAIQSSGKRFVAGGCPSIVSCCI